MMPKLRWLSRSALAIIAAAVLVPATTFAEGKPLRYVMAVKPGKAEPDVRVHGGREVQRWDNRRLVEIPRAAVDALARHTSVEMLWLLYDGTESDAPKYVLGPPDSYVRIGTQAVTTPPTWDSGVYAYDGSGNITAIGADTYTYDRAHRLVGASIDGVAATYKYDSFGNQVEREIGGATVRTPASLRSNRLDDAVYDRAGNQLSHRDDAAEFRYDATNMMVQRHKDGWNTPTRYIYTADDERLGTIGGNGHWTVRDFSGRWSVRTTRPRSTAHGRK